MSSLPSSLKQIALFLERLPGIGSKTANRLAFYFLRLPEEDLKNFASNIADLKTKTKFCKVCLNLTETELCEICEDKRRNENMVTVVEDVLDLLSFETGNIYDGVYHVLHGRIDPLNNIGPEDIYIDALVKRVASSKISELIIATNPDMEGEATAIYIKDRLKNKNGKLKITRLGYGLPMGANLEYADYMTLRKAIEGRTEY